MLLIKEDFFHSADFHFSIPNIEFHDLVSSVGCSRSKDSMFHLMFPASGDFSFDDFLFLSF